jgi:cytidylate kinase
MVTDRPRRARPARRTTRPARPSAGTKRVVITIDGPAGVGKSTTSKLLARRLGLVYLDTGATYRALAHDVLLHGVDPCNTAAVARRIPRLRLALHQAADGRLTVLLNNLDVTRAIRAEPVTEAAAIIAQHPRVRTGMVRLQRRLARSHSIVVEGRDTGSVVFPTAAYKFFLTADPRIRAARRREELLALHGSAPSLDQLEQQLSRRDELDRTRTVGPLIQPEGAIVVNTTESDAAKVVERMLLHVALSSEVKPVATTLASYPLDARRGR